MSCCHRFVLTFTQLWFLFIFKTDYCFGQCDESRTWEENDNDICTYTECECIVDNTTEVLVCRNYTADDQSNMALFIDICDSLRYAGCTDVNDLYWTNTGGSLERCSNENTDCPLYCSCNANDTDTDDSIYYTNVDVYQKTCYECECEQRGMSDTYYRDCGSSDSVNIDDDDWSDWTCPETTVEIDYLMCARDKDGTQKTCTNANDTSCYIEASFDLDIGTLNWDFRGNYSMLDGNWTNFTRKFVYEPNTTVTYGCESDLTENYFCNVFDALNNTHSCAMIEFESYNIEECDNHTIVGYNISYLQELQCCYDDICNFNYSVANCTYDETMNDFYTKINECQTSLVAVNSTYSYYDYCETGSFFDNYQYCEYVASKATFDYGCYCEAYAILYNSDNIDDASKSDIESIIDSYQSTIEAIYQDNGYCCDIVFSCDLDDKEASIDLSNYIVNFDIRLNNTNNMTFDETEQSNFISDLSSEMGLYVSEIIIANIEYDSLFIESNAPNTSTTQVPTTTPNVTEPNFPTVPGSGGGGGSSDTEEERYGEWFEWAILTIELTIGCDAAASQFINDLTDGEYSFGYDSSIDEIDSEYVNEQVEYSTTGGGTIIDSDVIDNDDSDGSSNSNSNSDTLSGGAIAAIIICILVFIVCVALIYWYVVVGKDKMRDRKEKKESASQEIRQSVVQNYGNQNGSPPTTPGRNQNGNKFSSPPNKKPQMVPQNSSQNGARMGESQPGPPPPPPQSY